MTQERNFVELEGRQVEIEVGGSLLALLESAGSDNGKARNPVALATVDGRRASLHETLRGGEEIEWIRLGDSEAHTTMLRSLVAVLAMAADELFPRSRLTVDFSLGPGIYCELASEQVMKAKELADLRARMEEIIAADRPFLPKVYGLQPLLKTLREADRRSSFRAARYIRSESVTMFQAKDSEDLFFGLQLPSTGYVRAWDLHLETPGFILVPSPMGRPHEIPSYRPQPKLFSTLLDYSRWMSHLSIHDIGNFNQHVVNGEAGELIQICEARHAAVIVEAAERVASLPPEGRLVLVAGPSSSGKTSFAKRMGVQLRVLGYHPRALSLDDYFVDREKTPRDEEGDYDYESLDALQTDLLNEHLAALLKGEAVRLCHYDFLTGLSGRDEETTTLDRGQPLIVEGIHALNPLLASSVDEHHRLRVYVSALCHMNIDNLTYIPTTLTRLYRRLVRDAQFRGYSASETLARWPKVREGENEHIFPFQNNADIFFNSGLAYELGVLKLWAEPRLAAVEPNDPNYGWARSLIETLTLILPLDARQVPPTSLLREFIGGSGFQY